MERIDINLCEDCPLRANHTGYGAKKWGNTEGPSKLREIVIWHEEGHALVTGTVGDAFQRTKRFSVGELNDGVHDRASVDELINNASLEADLCEGPIVETQGKISRLLGHNATLTCAKFELIEHREERL